MSLYSFSYSKPIYSNQYPTTCPQSSFNKHKQMGEIFLDKKTIIKKMQQIMLDAKDLQTKIFVSKTISYLLKHLNPDTKPFQQISLNCSNFKSNINQKPVSNLFQNNCSQIRPILNNNSIDVSLTMPLNNNQINTSITNDGKLMNQTAASEGFFSSSLGFKQNKTTVIQETISQAGTIQCQCGLFEGFLKMVSRLMDEGLIKLRQKSENQFLQIDQGFISQITQQLIEISQQKQKKLQNELMKLRQNLVQRQTQLFKLNQQKNKIEQICRQLKNSHKNKEKQTKKCQDQKIKMREKQFELELKLSNCIKKIQKANNSKLLLEQVKNHELNALRFGLQLKDNQIQKLKTIIQVCQKSQLNCLSYTSNIQNQQKNFNFSIPLQYSINLIQYQNQSTIQQSDKSTLQLNKNFKRNVDQLEIIKIQNLNLKNQCMLLYQKLNHYQLLNH